MRSGCIQYIEKVVDGVKTLVCDWEAQNAYQWNSICIGLIVLAILAVIAWVLEWRKEQKFKRWGL